MAGKPQKQHRHWFYLGTRVGRDLCLLGVGVLALIFAPPSVTHLSAGERFVGYTWAAMFVVGSLVCLLGVITDRAVSEIWGCSLVAAAFLVWMYAALRQPELTPASFEVALVFASGVFGQLYRIWMIATQKVIR